MDERAPLDDFSRNHLHMYGFCGVVDQEESGKRTERDTRNELRNLKENLEDCRDENAFSKEKLKCPDSSTNQSEENKGPRLKQRVSKMENGAIEMFLGVMLPS